MREGQRRAETHVSELEGVGVGSRWGLVPALKGIDTVVGQCGLYSQILVLRVDKDVRNHAFCG